VHLLAVDIYETLRLSTRRFAYLRDASPIYETLRPDAFCRVSVSADATDVMTNQGWVDVWARHAIDQGSAQVNAVLLPASRVFSPPISPTQTSHVRAVEVQLVTAGWTAKE